jgi:hypothetical protein
MSYNNRVPLDTRTVLLGSSIQDILKKTEKVRKGIDFRLYTVAGSGDKDTEDCQTVLTALSSMKNPNPIYQKDKNDVDKLLAEALDKVLISDRVRSCNDFYKTNNKKDNSLLTVG